MENRGIVSLAALYEYVNGDLNGDGFYGNSTAGRKYGAIAKEVTRDVAESQGFYLWGTYGPNGLWANIYLGKAGFGKTATLKARLLEELKDERGLVYVDTVPALKLATIGRQSYPEKWDEYYSHLTRALKKSGSTHIIWAAAPGLSNKQVGAVESDLIECLNPSANMSRPAPPDELQQETVKIVRSFRKLIHDNRSIRFPLNRQRG